MSELKIEDLITFRNVVHHDINVKEKELSDYMDTFKKILAQNLPYDPISSAKRAEFLRDINNYIAKLNYIENIIDGLLREAREKCIIKHMTSDNEHLCDN